MKTKKWKCHKCKNFMDDIEYCTMQKDIKNAVSHSCDGFDIKLKPKIKRVNGKVIKKKYDRHTDDSDFPSDFIRFIYKGGRYSARLGDVLR